MMLERTIWKCLYMFTKALIILFCDQYLHKPTIRDIHQRYLAHENKHGFHGMPRSREIQTPVPYEQKITFMHC